MNIRWSLPAMRLRLEIVAWLMRCLRPRSSPTPVALKRDRAKRLAKLASIVALNAQMTTQQNLGFTAANTGDAAEHIKRIWLQKRAFEEGNALVRCFEKTTGLGLEGKRNVFASAPLQVHEIGDRHHEIARHRRNRFARPAVRFEGARDRSTRRGARPIAAASALPSDAPLTLSMARRNQVSCAGRAIDHRDRSACG
jgi:hypothetical protein